MMGSTRIIRNYILLTDDPLQNAKREGMATSQKNISHRDYNPINIACELLGESVALETLFTEPLLRKFPEDRIANKEFSLSEEKELPAAESVIKGLENLRMTFETFSKSLKNVSEQYDDKSNQLRDDALLALEDGIHDFTAKLNEFVKFEDELTDKMIYAFDEAEASQKLHLQGRYEKHVPARSSVALAQQEKFIELQARAVAALDELKLKKFSAEQRVHVSQSKEKIKNKKNQTQIALENQLDEIPDAFNKFFWKLLKENSIPKQQQLIADIQTRIKTIEKTFASINYSQPPSAVFQYILTMAIAAEKVFLNDLISHGDFLMDITNLLCDTAIDFHKVIDSILKNKNLQDIRLFVPYNMDKIRGEYNVWGETTVKAVQQARAKAEDASVEPVANYMRM